MKKLVMGILAHVDAGKTTLSEAMLYECGRIKKLGRVDNQNAYLDNHQLERQRGITIFSKQAMMNYSDTNITLLDTPGHVDFSAEMERTLQVLDYAILVISAADGIQGHTKTLWSLLERYKIPTFIFINKMDQKGADKVRLIAQLKKQLSDSCVDFMLQGHQSFNEELVLCDEGMMRTYLEKNVVDMDGVKEAIRDRRIFPCYFGSALRLQGVKKIIEGIVAYSIMPIYGAELSARVYKISRDEQGNRLTHLKLTGGRLQVRMPIQYDGHEEKVNQIRLYSGEKYEAVNEVTAGQVCTVTGLSFTKAGEAIGQKIGLLLPALEPVLAYRIILPENCDSRVMLPKLKQLEEECPELNIVWNEDSQEIQVRIMGEVQLEVLQSIIKNRFGVDVSFGSGKILYRETIDNVVEGVGHFEPLRHYAEVHLLLEPGEEGSGLEFKDNCSDDVLSKNWRNLIISAIKEKRHKGVLTGSEITDIKITLISGKAHIKHTDSGDFREAAYRAIRQGLMEAKSVLLEPYYSFQLVVPQSMVGRAMNDIDRMNGKYTLSCSDDENSILIGTAPVAEMNNYQREVTVYTRGKGRLSCSINGYKPCHNAQSIIDSIGYDPERDLANPSSSVFCSNGAGTIVTWNHVKEFMHLEACIKHERSVQEELEACTPSVAEKWIDTEEVDRILNKSNYANQGRKQLWKKQKPMITREIGTYSRESIALDKRQEYLLVDGYNVVYAWPELNEISKDSMEVARGRLLDRLSKYRGVCSYEIIVVFDAYLVQGHKEETLDYHNIHVVYTKEAQTADQYIEKFAHDNKEKYHITVATSDGLQQVIIRGAGCSLLSSRELKKVIDNADERVMKEYKDNQIRDRAIIRDMITEEKKKHIEKLVKK